MNTNNLIESADMRALTDAELEEINGGLLFLAAVFAWSFAVGFLGGLTYSSIMRAP